MEDGVAGILERFLAGSIPANVAAMQLLAEAGSPADAEAAVASRLSAEADETAAEKLRGLRKLLRANPTAWHTIRTVLAQADHTGAAKPAGWSDTFDRIARFSPEAGAALYTLGSPELLRAATDEVVARLREWGLPGPGRTLLEIGCGYGRLSLALAGDFARVIGLDVSAEMIAEARRRGAAHANVSFARSSGEDLSDIESGAADVVLAADVFPYLVSAGQDLAFRHVGEAGRALRPGGALVIFNYSYRRNEALDREEIRLAFAAAGLCLQRDGTRDLALWDAQTYLGRKTGG